MCIRDRLHVAGRPRRGQLSAVARLLPEGPRTGVPGAAGTGGRGDDGALGSNGYLRARRRPPRAGDRGTAALACPCRRGALSALRSVSYTHLRAHETVLDIVCRLLLEKKK